MGQPVSVGYLWRLVLLTVVFGLILLVVRRVLNIDNPWASPISTGIAVAAAMLVVNYFTNRRPS